MALVRGGPPLGGRSLGVVATSDLNLGVGVSEQDAARIADGLTIVLADTFRLYLRTHGYHWNVVGAPFRCFHLMFGEQYSELWEALDLIAERIRALGFLVPFTMRDLHSASRQPEDEDLQPDAMEMIRRLLRGHETVIESARSVLQVAENADDAPTVDILNGRLRSHEKTAWQLRATLA